jgi:hypothetical protein
MRPIVIVTVVSCLIMCTVLFCPVQAVILPGYNQIYFTVSNDEGAKYNAHQNNTYYIAFAGPGRGQNANHITADVAAPYGQVTTTGNLSGVFYITDTGGSGYGDNEILMVAVNGTIPDNSKLHIRSSGYNWTPKPGLEEKPLAGDINYIDGALNETFTKEDFSMVLKSGVRAGKLFRIRSTVART